MAMRSVRARAPSVLNFSAKRDKRKLSRRIFLVPPRTARTRNVSHSRRFLAAVTEPVHICAVCPPVIGRRGGGAGRSYLLYCACKKLNSSLILSIDSPMVNLKGDGWPWPPLPGAA